MTITITHTAAEGTLVTGTTRDHAPIIKSTGGFRWSRNIGTSGAWYVPSSRDRKPRMDRIDALAKAFADAGIECEVCIDTAPRAIDEREADRADRLEARQDRLNARSERLAATAEGHFKTLDQISGMIPLGQPILVGHHSERRHRKDLARMDTAMGKGVEAMRDSREAARQAAASAANQRHKESGPATIRRIERLEAERRDIERKLTPCSTSGRHVKSEAEGRELDCPICWKKVTTTAGGEIPEHGAATGEWLDRLLARRDEIDNELTYDREHLESLKFEGYHEWGPNDFEKGDRVNDSATVVRVNKKSLTVIHDSFAYANFTSTLPYHKVKTKKARGISGGET